MSSFKNLISDYIAANLMFYSCATISDIQLAFSWRGTILPNIYEMKVLGGSSL